MAYLYDFLHPYVQKNHAGKIELYAATFKKWIDLTIKNGVPQNNWNLHQAKFILKVAMVLEDNKNYADGKGDKFHDYFYHNLGQELFVRDAKGQSLDLRPSDEMTFAGGHLFALDYMWDKKSAKTDEDYQAIWKMSMPDGNHISMNLWMKGYPDREVFSIKAPPAKSFRGDHGIPYKVEEEPFLTIAARQHGEAWNRPFVSVFEPTTEKEGQSIRSIEAFNVNNGSPDFVGLIVESKSGRKDYIFSSAKDEKVAYNTMPMPKSLLNL